MELPAIRDQRTLTGTTVHATPDDVRSHWRAWARERGFVRPTGLTVRDLTITGVTVPAHVNHGRWVADCPNPECNGAAACWRENPDACCLDCGWVFAIDWPTAEETTQAVEILTLRPRPEQRSWNPHRGETVADLKAQNLMRADRLPAPGEA